MFEDFENWFYININKYLFMLGICITPLEYYSFLQGPGRNNFFAQKSIFVLITICKKETSLSYILLKNLK